MKAMNVSLTIVLYIFLPLSGALATPIVYTAHGTILGYDIINTQNASVERFNDKIDVSGTITIDSEPTLSYAGPNYLSMRYTILSSMIHGEGLNFWGPGALNFEFYYSVFLDRWPLALRPEYNITNQNGDGGFGAVFLENKENFFLDEVLPLPSILRLADGWWYDNEVDYRIEYHPSDILLTRVPEPSTMVLIGPALIGLVAYSRKKILGRRC